MDWLRNCNSILVPTGLKNPLFCCSSCFSPPPTTFQLHLLPIQAYSLWFFPTFPALQAEKMPQPHTWGFKHPFESTLRKKKTHMEYPMRFLGQNPKFHQPGKIPCFYVASSFPSANFSASLPPPLFPRPWYVPQNRSGHPPYPCLARTQGEGGGKIRLFLPSQEESSSPKNSQAHGHTLELLILGKGGVVHEVLLGLWPGGAVGDIGHVIQDVLQSFPVPLPQLLGLFLRGKVSFLGSVWGGLDRNVRYLVCSPRKYESNI